MVLWISYWLCWSAFQDNIICLNEPVHVCPLKGGIRYGVRNRIDKFNLCVVVKLL